MKIRLYWQFEAHSCDLLLQEMLRYQAHTQAYFPMLRFDLILRQFTRK